MKLSEGKRLDSWEITHVQSENSVSVANTYQPGGSIKVVQISEDEFIAYSAAFKSEVKNTLNTDDWVGGINALVKEMRENISKGISNTPDNLKTKLSTGGIELTWKELMNMQKTGKYIDKFLDAGGAGHRMCINRGWI